MSATRRKYPTDWRPHNTPRWIAGEVGISGTVEEPILTGTCEAVETRALSARLNDLRHERRIAVTLHSWEVPSDIRALMTVMAVAWKQIEPYARREWERRTEEERT